MGFLLQYRERQPTWRPESWPENGVIQHRVYEGVPKNYLGNPFVYGTMLGSPTNAANSVVTATAAVFAQTHAGGCIKFAASGRVYWILSVSTDGTQATLTENALYELPGSTFLVSTSILPGACPPGETSTIVGPFLLHGSKWKQQDKGANVDLSLPFLTLTLEPSAGFQQPGTSYVEILGRGVVAHGHDSIWHTFGVSYGYPDNPPTIPKSGDRLARTPDTVAPWLATAPTQTRPYPGRVLLTCTWRTPSVKADLY